MNQRPKFHFFGDPICLASMIIYAVNRWYLKPHHIGGAFTQGYVNDLLCLPLFLPLILGVQRVIRLRKHDAPPRMWEVVQHAIIFSILFEVILPRYPRQFHTTADPWDAVAYLVGGVAAWMCWRMLAAVKRRWWEASYYEVAMRSVAMSSVAVALCLTTGCSSHGRSDPVDERRAIQIATQKASALGYKVENMTIHAEGRGNVYKIAFAPSGPGLGGDVTVSVDSRTSSIIAVQRGQ